MSEKIDKSFFSRAETRCREKSTPKHIALLTRIANLVAEALSVCP